MTIYDDRVVKASELFRKGFQCSQAVFAAFAPGYGLSEEQALRIGAGFGGGMCKGEVCGAVTGALMVIGLVHGHDDPEDAEGNARVKRLTREMMDRFSGENGSFVCRDLLGYDLSSDGESRIARNMGLFTEFCPRMVISASEMLADILEREGL